MKKLALFILAFLCIAPFCFSEETKGNNVLVVYYSWSGNTRAVALEINKKVNGKIFEIDTKIPYPKDYKATVDQAKKEINDGVKPELKDELKEDLSKYDTIFIGTPNWWGTMAPAVTSFLSKYDLSGKTIIPFVTHGSGGEQNCITDMKKAIKDGKFKEALILNGELSKTDKGKEEIAAWLKGLGY